MSLALSKLSIAGKVLQFVVYMMLTLYFLRLLSPRKFNENIEGYQAHTFEY